MSRLTRWLALGGCLLSACVTIADKHVEEAPAAGGSVAHQAGSSSRPGQGPPGGSGTGSGGRATVVPLPQAETPGGGGEATGNGAGGWPGNGEVLDLGGAPADCGTTASTGGSPEDLSGCFELVEGAKRCEQAQAHAQGPYLERVCGATSLAECEAACVERSDCTAVSDYLNETGYDACSLRHTPCGNASSGRGWEEEDGGKEYIKVCPAGQPCHLEYLGDWVRCDDNGGDYTILTTSLRDCVEQCLDDPTCVSVTDHFYLGRVPGCYVYTGTCDAPEPLPYGDTGRAYVRRPCNAD